MKILFTGASSFTGYWFVKELAAAGHEVVMIFRRAADQYEGIRRTRVGLAAKCGTPVFGCSFGSQDFLQLIKATDRFDLLCHHAAEVTDYKSPEFDVVSALHNNTFNFPGILSGLAEKGCPAVLLTGSVFESGEGAGSDGLPSLSPYGLSKGLTSEMVRYYATAQGLQLGKFVIANPFGPYEEPRFTAYLVRSWHEGRTAVVNTPEYIRDNIHVSLLAKIYVDFIHSLSINSGFRVINPSGYVESQGAFAMRFARKMRERLGLPCELELKRQTEFAEPRIRINTDAVDSRRLGWDEETAWDGLAEYYRNLLGDKKVT
jgi:nucleoside-diphosphate-sugar epimerase